MTRDEALNKAETLWGEDALALEVAPYHFAVGIFFGQKREVFGRGESWEAAFAAADIRMLGEKK